MMEEPWEAEYCKSGEFLCYNNSATGEKRFPTQTTKQLVKAENDVFNSGSKSVVGSKSVSLNFQHTKEEFPGAHGEIDLSLGEAIDGVRKTGNCLFAPDNEIWQCKSSDKIMYPCVPRVKTERENETDDKNTCYRKRNAHAEIKREFAVKTEPGCLSACSCVLSSVAPDESRLTSDIMECTTDEDDEVSETEDHALFPSKVVTQKEVSETSTVSCARRRKDVTVPSDAAWQHPYRCSICSNAFMHRKGLVKHMRLHKQLVDGAAYVVENKTLTDGESTSLEKTRPGIIYGCSECDETSESKPKMHLHCKRHSDVRPYQCNVCKRDFTESKFLEIHVRGCHFNERPFPCNQCDKRFKTHNALKGHIHSHSGLKPYECDMCGKKCATPGSLGKHQRDVHEKVKNYVCEFCGKAFSASSTLVIHRRSHTGERPYECSICGKGFSGKPGLDNHIAIHSKERKFKCDICDYTFKLKNGLDKHVMVHIDQRTRYQCSLCDTSLSTQAGLRRHLNMHENARKYECSQCEKRFNEKRTLQAHFQRKHENAFVEKTSLAVQRFECPVCRRMLSTKQSLLDHIHTHSTDKPFKCEICTNSYVNEKGLKTHMKIKHGTAGDGQEWKGFVCQICQQSFSSPYLLKRHAFVHGEGHTCEKCGSKFICKSHLTHHMVVHGEHETLSCELCNKTFVSRRYLGKHKRGVHGKDKYSFKCKHCPAKAFSTRSGMKRHVKTAHEKPDNTR